MNTIEQCMKWLIREKYNDGHTETLFQNDINKHYKLPLYHHFKYGCIHIIILNLILLIEIYQANI